MNKRSDKIRVRKKNGRENVPEVLVRDGEGSTKTLTTGMLKSE